MISQMDAQQAADKAQDELQQKQDLANQKAIADAEIEATKLKAAQDAAKSAKALDKAKLAIEAERAKAAWAKAQHKKAMAEQAIAAKRQLSRPPRTNKRPLPERRSSR
jgi:microcystin-dependent protein